MKNLKNISLLLLLSTMLVACDTNGNAGGSSGGKKENEIVLSNFDSYGRSFSSIKISEEFGRVELNQNPAYAKSGNSCKIIPIGNYATGAKPFIVIPTSSQNYEYNYSNFSKVTSVSFSIYNASNESKTIGVGLAYASDGSTKDNPTEFELTPGWNDITLPINVSLINLFQDITNCKGIFIIFDNAHVRGDKEEDFQNAAQYYLDDMILHTVNEEIPLTQIDLDENEICYFEKPYQSLIWEAGGSTLDSIPDVNLVLADKYNIDTTQGYHCLRMVTHPTTYNRDLIGWIHLSKRYINSINLLAYDENDEFAFDIYNNSDDDKLFFTEFYNAEGSYKAAKQNFTAPAHSWYTYRVKFSTLNKNNDDIPDGQKVTYAVDYLNDTGMFGLAWRHYDGVDQEFFLDNFRFIKNNN